MTNVFIYYANGECTYIKSNHACLIADEYLFGIYGLEYIKRFSVLKGIDDKGDRWVIYKEQGREVEVIIQPRKRGV